MKSFYELYSSYQLDYNYFDYKNYSTFSLFVVRNALFKNYQENFEKKVLDLEGKFDRLQSGMQQDEEGKLQTCY